jgi:hypothetical protein
VGSYQLTDYTGSAIGREDDLYRIALVFTFDIFKYGSINLGAEQERRDSNVVGDYVDNMVYANLTLVFPARPPGQRDTHASLSDSGGGFGF